MKPCIVGIGGAGGNILKQFLQIQDIDLLVHKFGDHLAFGNVKGIWLDSASQDVENPKQTFYGNMENGSYPFYLISHDMIEANSPTRQYVIDKYGFDLKAQGYDRRAEYLKGVFEIFESDSDLMGKASKEYKGDKNPLPSYIWKRGIRPFTTISKHPINDIDTKESSNSSLEGYTKRPRALSTLTSMLGVRQNNHVNEPSKCDSILFIASLGGGTGTGFINPITSYVRSEELAFPIFAMGILTERGKEAREATEGQRDLGAVIAMNDLLTKKPGKGIDGLIIIDNQILAERFHKNWVEMDQTICCAMKPMLDKRNYPGAEQQEDTPAMRRVLWEADKTNCANEEEESILFPPILVPCYHSRELTSRSIDTLVEKALAKEGRLFPCDPRKADRAYVFARGFFSALDIDKSVAEMTGLLMENVKVYRKIANGRFEDVLIILRNPYGGSLGSHKIEDTFEWRMHEVISESLEYMENPTNIIEYPDYNDFTREHLRSYFYGAGGLKEELANCLKRLENGDKPIFLNPLSIFRGDIVPALSPEGISKVGLGTIGVDEARLREMVREEVKRLLMLKDCKDNLKEIIP